MGAAITFTYHLVKAPAFKGPVFLGIGDRAYIESDLKATGSTDLTISKMTQPFAELRSVIRRHMVSMTIFPRRLITKSKFTQRRDT